MKKLTTNQRIIQLLYEHGKMKASDIIDRLEGIYYYNGRKHVSARISHLLKFGYICKVDGYYELTGKL